MIVLLLVAGLALEAQVARLGDEDPARRRQARRLLLAAGDLAVPNLRTAQREGDPETRRAATDLLDCLARRTLEGKRNNLRFAQPVAFKVDPRQARALLNHPQVRAHYAQKTRGALAHWADPTVADLNGLLVTLSRHLRHLADPGHRVHLIDEVFAVDAIAWRLGHLSAAPKHWSVRWILERDVLPALTDTMIARRRDLTLVETQVCTALLESLRRFGCEETRRRLMLRLDSVR